MAESGIGSRGSPGVQWHGSGVFSKLRKRDGKMDSLKRSWEAARDAAGLPGVRFHDLRHRVRRYAQFAPDRRIQTARLVDGTVGSLTVKDRQARYNAKRMAA
jgi:integrase